LELTEDFLMEKILVLRGLSNINTNSNTPDTWSRCSLVNSRLIPVSVRLGED